MCIYEYMCIYTIYIWQGPEITGIWWRIPPGHQILPWAYIYIYMYMYIWIYMCTYIKICTYGKGLKLREFDDGSLHDTKLCLERIYAHILIYVCVYMNIYIYIYIFMARPCNCRNSMMVPSRTPDSAMSAFMHRHLWGEGTESER